MKILDNINHTVREDLQDTMQKGSRVSIAAACFSIYAYQELKKQLEEIAELRFIFTSPTFVQENTPKERREFYIPKLIIVGFSSQIPDKLHYKQRSSHTATNYDRNI